MTATSRRAAVCSVGSELVSGEQADTNAAWLSRRLSQIGWEPGLHVAVGDDTGQIAGALGWLVARSGAVVVGGGLGPTSDDRTREAVAAAAGVELEHREPLAEAIRDRFAEFGARMSPSNLRQARLPAGAEPYRPVGTAPGFRLQISGADGPVPVHVLPGVPWELKAMFDRDVEPALLGASGRVRLTRVVHVAGMAESRVAEQVDDALARTDADVDAAYRATGTEIQVRLTATAGDREAAESVGRRALAVVRDALGPAVAGVDGDTLEAAVVRLLTDRGQTVAAAESATGGQICSRLADVPGASATLVGGAVVYATDSKRRVLGLDADLVEAEGPVSRPVTAAMATSVRESFGADWGVAVTGVAGPEPQGDRGVGTVFWAVAGPDGSVDVHGRTLPGDRATVRSRLGSAALEALRLRLLED